MTPWRFCNHCFVMFFDGNPQQGVCPPQLRTRRQASRSCRTRPTVKFDDSA